ncbi:MAG: helix-turn-helix transcriptional regulator [Lactococcus chungangensis]|jgi:DNA-binding transcriptional regulator GbsR (MarR family)|uniref:Helix-turn-helix transcriptional regulator n=1 Tax=Pseudolactococcus chungangensis TaxID=451457 RepID=A0A847J1H1_9LACT|nr:ArsR family transcriptional regulator [Bacilli bacterium]NLH35189.1 helix-turn-helix transcriptional regulator [Lactococcus chungangensis]
MKKMTVTELSEAFGVTRQAMNNRIKKLSDEYLAKNDRGVTVVNEDGIKRLEKHYGKVILEDRTDKNQEAEKNSVNIDFDKIITQLIKDKNTEISRLSDQIAMKDHQIAEKDKQLDQQQQLTAKALTEREQTLLELEQEKSKGFFAKLFRK